MPISRSEASKSRCWYLDTMKQFTILQWRDLPSACYPGYNGTRPRMMIVNGTADTAVLIPLLYDQLAQRSNFLDITWTQNMSNDPIANWEMIQYGNGIELIGYEAEGGGHMSHFQVDNTSKWFGLMQSVV